jgi:hypothetical protein
MSGDGTIVLPPTSGNLEVETLADGSVVATGKTLIGPSGVNEGPAHRNNPFPIEARSLDRIELLLTQLLEATLARPAPLQGFPKPRRGYSSIALVVSDLHANSVDVVPRSANLLSCLVCNENVNVRYLQFFNQKTKPTSGQKPWFGIPIGGATLIGIGETVFREDGLHFADGIGWAWSQSATSYDPTNVVATDHTTILFEGL